MARLTLDTDRLVTMVLILQLPSACLQGVQNRCEMTGKGNGE